MSRELPQVLPQRDTLQPPPHAMFPRLPNASKIPTKLADESKVSATLPMIWPYSRID